MAYSAGLAGSKLRAKLGASLNENVSAPTSDFAQNQLKKMGWTGEGLGKRRQGRASHIKVTKREDNVGLGHSDLFQDTQQWWKDSVSDTLAKLSSEKKKKAKRKAKEYTDEELFEATGGARFGMRAQRRATGKWARTESQTEDDEREAWERVEWNGRGNAEIKLESDGSGEPKKKKRRKEKNVVESEVSTGFGDENDTSSDMKVKKKKKKDKKQKKKSSKKDKKRRNENSHAAVDS